MAYSVEYHDAAGWAGTEYGVYRLSLAKQLARLGVDDADLTAGVVRDARGRRLYEYPRPRQPA